MARLAYWSFLAASWALARAEARAKLYQWMGFRGVGLRHLGQLGEGIGELARPRPRIGSQCSQNQQPVRRSKLDRPVPLWDRSTCFPKRLSALARSSWHL
jgi:hypothetical protein